MCRYSTINLNATECSNIRTGLSAHIFTKYSYWLCKDARGDRPCSRPIPKEDQIGSDVGSRQGRCPVCDKINNANDEYEAAVERATSQFNIAVNSAWQKKEDDIKNSDYVTDIISAPIHHRRRRYSHSWS